MGVLDLRHNGDVRGRVHYTIEVQDRVLAYAYIRKNGCSAFKNFFVAESLHKKQAEEGQMEFMARCHRAREGDVRSADDRIAVLRKPHSRMISVFRNKFIQQAGNTDIFNNFREVVGSPQDCTFRAFVHQYLVLPQEQLDPHVYSQASHLLPIHYNRAMLLEDLASGMSELLGPEIATRHFTQKANATSTQPQNGEPDDVSELPASELNARYTATREMPSTDALCSPALRKDIEERYADDCRMIEQLVPSR
jgi:hypothetical protein